jgi:hypothetical protein
MDINNVIPLYKFSKLTNFIFMHTYYSSFFLYIFHAFFFDSSLSLINLIVQKPET